MTEPALTTLSLGAGVQSTTIALLSAEGRLPKLDAAIFADTRWEPRAVYDHLDRLDREVLQPAGIPLHRVTSGNIRADALDPEQRSASMPLYILNTDGTSGMVRRQCTSEYKLKPIKAAIRALLGYPHPIRMPRDVYADTWVGISRDEIHRAKDSDVKYQRLVFPLIGVGIETDLVGADGKAGWTRRDCLRFLESRGFASTPKSACVGCPFHGNRQWRELRDNHPEDWADAVAFDDSIRNGNAHATTQLRGTAFLHRSRMPLGQAPIDRVTSAEWKAQQTDIFDQIADLLTDDEWEEGATDSCSPFTCRGDGL